MSINIRDRIYTNRLMNIYREFHVADRDKLIHMKYGLSDTVLEQLDSVFAHFPPIEQVVLYGSRAKGNFREGSDIDITLIGSQLDQDTVNKLSWELDDLMLPYKFDISIYHQIKNPSLLDHIQRVGKVIFGGKKREALVVN